MIFGDMPDVLVDKFGEMLNFIGVIKAKRSEEDPTYKFLLSVTNTMKMAWSWMEGLEWIHKEAQLTKEYNKFLVEKIHFLEKRLEIFDVVARLECEVDIEKVLEGVDKYLNNTEITNLRMLKKANRERRKPGK
jgi:hypothetical protein